MAPPSRRQTSRTSEHQKPTCMVHCCRAFLAIFILISVAIVCLGVFLVLRHKQVFREVLQRNMPLTPDSPMMDNFKEAPIDIYMKFHLFNLTNEEEVLSGGRPVLQEIGPYVYLNPRIKQNISFNEDNSQVSFDEVRYYHFQPDLSNGSEDDEFISIDMVAFGILTKAYESGRLALLAKQFIRSKRDTPFTRHRVGDFLTGKPDKLLKKLLDFMGQEREPNFGILINMETGQPKNGSVDGSYTLYTGKDDLSHMNGIVEYNGKRRWPDIWPSTIKDPKTGAEVNPNDFRGGLGSGQPLMNQNSVLTAFSGDACLTLNVTFQKRTKVGPIDTLRFGMDTNYWCQYTGQLNRGLCQSDDLSECFGNCLVNATGCRGAAMAMSLPHFMGVDEYYRDKVVGLNPDPEKHDLYLDIDPLVGLPLKIRKRMQMNVPLRAMPFASFTNLPEFTLFPLLWLEEGGQLKESAIDTLKGKLHGAYTLFNWGGYVLLLGGITALVATVLVFLIWNQRRSLRLEEEAAKAQTQAQQQPLI